MASRLSSPSEKAPKILLWLFGGAVWGCFAAWLLVRLWVPLSGQVSGKLLGLAAFLLSGLICYLALRFRLIKTLCLPWGTTWKTALCALVAFLLGAVFDISYAMLHAEGELIIHPLLRLLCHAGNGVVFAIIMLTLLWSAKHLTCLSGTEKWQLLILWGAVNALTLLFLLTSKTVYFWDNAGYWSVAMSLVKEPLGFAQLRRVLVTTITMDYNHLLAYPISLLMRIFGPSRAVFLLATANLYTFPGLW
ncbi:MAG: hypothetical protein K2F83_00575, partial [Oscillospiraceae bacterium]|nr:hypothetical protein [Oscillospiraceae bacterium]